MGKHGVFSSIAKPDTLTIVKNTTGVENFQKTEMIWSRDIRKQMIVEFREKDFLIVFCEYYEQVTGEFLYIVTYDIVNKKTMKKLKDFYIDPHGTIGPDI